MPTQIEFIEQITRIGRENPDYESHFCVDSDERVVEAGWTAHRITGVNVCKWLVVGEQIITDDDLIVDYFENEFWNECADGTELKRAVENAFEDVPIAICIHTKAG